MLIRERSGWFTLTIFIIVDGSYQQSRFPPFIYSLRICHRVCDVRVTYSSKGKLLIGLENLH